MNNKKVASFLLLLLLSLLLIGCGAVAPATPTPDTLENAADNPAVQALLTRLAAEASVAPETFNIQDVRAVEWPDTCLGMEIPDMACAEAITPGYIIQVEVDGLLTVYHTNEDGSRIVLAYATH